MMIPAVIIAEFATLGQDDFHNSRTQLQQTAWLVNNFGQTYYAHTRSRNFSVFAFAKWRNAWRALPLETINVESLIVEFIDIHIPLPPCLMVRHLLHSSDSRKLCSPP